MLNRLKISKGYQEYAFLMLLYVLLAFINITFVITDEVYFKVYNSIVSIDEISKIINISNKTDWLNYVVLPLIATIRISYTAVCLYVGCMFLGLRIYFKSLIKVALYADFVYVFSLVFKFISLIFFIEINSIDDLSIKPLSVMRFLNNVSINEIFVYPLSLLNIFELMYWLLLSLLLSVILSDSLKKSLIIVFCSYGTGFMIWVSIVMFLTLSFSP